MHYSGNDPMTSTDSIEEYVRIVEREIEQYKKFRALLIEEQNLLASGQILNLQENLRSQSVLLREIRNVEEYREMKKDGLAEELAIPEKPVTLRKIAEMIADNRKERLLSYLEEFRFVVNDIIRINRNNQKLVEHGRQFIQEQIEGIYRALNKEAFYGPEKRPDRNRIKTIRIFDRKI